MKHIGIVVITTVGACICVNEIVAEMFRRTGSDHHPEYTMHALPSADYQAVGCNWDEYADRILSSITKLKRSGADFIIIPSNTPHFGIAKIQKYSPLPVLNLIELSADNCKERGFKKVAVLGTKMTMQAGLYTQPLEQRGILPIIPDNEACERIDHLIEDEIIPSKINPASVIQVAYDIQQLACDAVILGCTELPAVYNENNLHKPVIDTTRLLAHKALDYALT